MIQELQTGILDINNKYNIDFSCKQLDDIILSIIVYDKSLPADLSNYNCRLKAFKADQVPVIQNTNISIKGNVVTIKASKQLTTTQGTVKAELQFINKTTGEKKSTFYINIEVVASVLGIDRIISTPTCTLLEIIDKKLEQVENIGDVLEESKKTRDDLVIKTNTANKSKKDLVQVTTAANNKKKEVEGIIKNADATKNSLANTINNKKQEVNTAIKNANSIKDNLVSTGNKIKKDIDNSSTIATSKKIKLDKSNVQAEKNIETLNSFGDASQLTKDVTTLKTKVLENTLTSITTDSTLTKLPNSENSFVRNMQILGKTLQNLVGAKAVPSNSIVEGSKWIVKGESNTKKDSRLIFSEGLIEDNHLYTVILTVEKNDYPKGELALKFNLNNYNTEDRGYFKIYGGETGTIIKVIKTEPISNIEYPYIETIKSTANIIVSDVMILEGEVKEIPPYFKGIQSTGEAEGNKISILSKSKNLLDTNNDVKLRLNPNGYCSWDGNKLVVDTGDKPARYFACYFQIKLYKGVNYKIDFKPNIISGIRMCDIKTLNNGYITKANPKTNFTVPNTDYYNIIFYSTGDTEALGKTEYTDIIIVANSDDTNYVEPKTDKTTILVGNEPLKGLPDGTADIIDVEKNERTVNVGQMMLDEAGNYELWRNSDTKKTLGVIYFNPLIRNVDYYSQNPVICNKLPTAKSVVSINNEEWDSPVIAQWSEYNKFALRIPKSELSTLDIAGVKKWIKDNKLEVYYRLANPITEKLDIKDTLQTFTDGYMQLDNAITPVTHLEYSTNLPSALDGLTQITDKLVDDVTNVEITISDMDAELDEARKGKATLNKRLEEDTKNITQLSNPSLLINDSFQVWQRGERFDSPNRTFTADRWYFCGDGSDYEVSKSNGLKLNVTKFQGTYLNMEYHFDLDLYEKLKGKQVTISIKLKNKSLINYIGLRAYPDNSKRIVNTKSKDFYTWTTTVPVCSSNCTKFTFYLQKLSEGILDIEYIKLELGSVATPFVPRSYGEELMLCQRYYQVATVPTQMVMCDENQIAICVPLQNKMRAKPSLTENPSIFLHDGKGKVYDFGNNITKIALGDSAFFMESSSTKIQIPNNLMCSVNQSSAKNNNSSGMANVKLDAEIY
ncbi:hypothetical protein [Clostridium taeniosporum]|uniref:Viral A-type inclusion protein n=1 Tax=Clostridium taeniosporum TaxID=394958 RepID=A0A1D7XLT8_9CLOT|nr:hypothetical protein [Clostridium taeniosporum]AOR24296.1 hypothetical protein BGI42_11360 [Clostridium taeniosporum]